MKLVVFKVLSPSFNLFKKCHKLGRRFNQRKMGKRKRDNVEVNNSSVLYFEDSEESLNTFKSKKKKQKIINISSTDNIENEFSSTNKSRCQSFDSVSDSIRCDSKSETKNGENIEDIDTTTCKNYALRPRPCLRRPVYKRDFIDEELSSCNNTPSVEVFRRRRGRGSQRLSKYRRRTANARERHRMKEINNAFKTLREVLPRPTKMKESNLTKITTLRMAVDYIQALDDLLRNTEITLECQTQTSTPTTITTVATTTQSTNISSTNTSSAVFQESLITDFLLNLSSCGSFGESITSLLGPQGSLTSKDLKEELGCTYSLEDTSMGLQNSVVDQEDDPIALLLSSQIDDSVF